MVSATRKKRHTGDAPLKRVPVCDIKFGQRHRKDMGDLKALAASINTLGLLQPIVVTRDNVLVAGERRLRAVAIELDWQTIPAYVTDRLDDALLLLQAERDENTCRKDFTPSEAVAIGKALEESERQAARERRARPGSPRSGKLPEQGTKGDTREKVAAAVGMSGKTYEKAKAVVEAAEADPGLAPVVEEMDRTGKVDPAYKKLKGAARAGDDGKLERGREAVSAFAQHDGVLRELLDIVRDSMRELKKPGAGTATFVLDLLATAESFICDLLDDLKDGTPHPSPPAADAP
jgi:ParB-like chromosome segregation protein Spo0J